VDADDLGERGFGAEAERLRARRVETARPAGNDALDQRILSPAIRRSAAICSATVQATPGIVRLTRGPSRSLGSAAAWSRKPTAERGLACQCMTLSATGSTACSPASGSRMIEEKKPDAALLGRPGRTETVGNLIPTPSTKPRRL
jgi:hypothetical protein